MEPKYNLIEFPKLDEINNFEYYKTYFNLEIMKIKRLSKKIIPKLKKMYRAKMGE